MSDRERNNLLDEVESLFYHGYNNYLEYAFPEDELRPVSCSYLTRNDASSRHTELNDVLGNFSLTLIDSLSTLATLASWKNQKRDSLAEFQSGISLLVELYGDGSKGPAGQGSRARGFDLESKVQVFEAVIRGVGGLLSGHLFAIGSLPITGYNPQWETRNGTHGIFWPNGFVYNGQLLRLAYDLAVRLLPAFYSSTGLPYPRVNLRRGIPFYPNSPLHYLSEAGTCPVQHSNIEVNAEITETCSAGAGSLILEFSTLSRLVGDPVFEFAAKTAFWSVWNRKSSIGLIGSGINSESGRWISSYAGIGAGTDSFFEYAFKSYILLSGHPFDINRKEYDAPEAFLAVWMDALDSIYTHLYSVNDLHPHFIQGDMFTGSARGYWIDSLSAFFPGLLALSGQVEKGIESHLLFAALWTRYAALPERWSVITGNTEDLKWWNGRPELVESTWYLYSATHDPWYLHVGEMILKDIQKRCWTECGWAGLVDVLTGEKADRMESFFLAETAKYLHLLFNVDHPLNNLDNSFVFNTEGHPLIIPKSVNQQDVRKYMNTYDGVNVGRGDIDGLTCPRVSTVVPFSISNMTMRKDLFHAAGLARLHIIEKVEKAMVWSGDTDKNNSKNGSLWYTRDSPNNNVFFPWTLPKYLIPHFGVSSSPFSPKFYFISLTRPS